MRETYTRNQVSLPSLWTPEVAVENHGMAIARLVSQFPSPAFAPDRCVYGKQPIKAKIKVNGESVSSMYRKFWLNIPSFGDGWFVHEFSLVAIHCPWRGEVERKKKKLQQIVTQQCSTENC